MRWLTAIARTPSQSAAISAATSARVCCAVGCAEYSSRVTDVPAVVIPHDTGEADDGSCGLMRDETLVLGEFDGLLGEFGAQHDGGHCDVVLARKLIERVLAGLRRARRDRP